ncbi:MAG: tetratricopeptide repeat protein, partial [Candidatus Hodarchaeales archaeon]
MNEKKLENLYVTGKYSFLLKEIKELAYDTPSATLNKIEKAVCLSYHTRTLIRLGRIHEAEKLINRIVDFDCNEPFSISALLCCTSRINLLITKGRASESLELGMCVKTLIEKNKTELSKYPELMGFWCAFFYFLLGIANFYQFQNDQARFYFQKGLKEDHTNLYVRAKCLYYTAFLEQEQGNQRKFFELLEDSLEIFKSLDARQGIAWIRAWLGNYFLQKGELEKAQTNFHQALDSFRLISDSQGIRLVNSLIGLMHYQVGNLKEAKGILEDSFESAMQIGNPMIASYCLIPLVLLYIGSGNRNKAERCIKEFQKLSKISSSDRAKLHCRATEAIFLKSSPRLIDKARAQQLFLQLLKDKDDDVQSHGAYVWITSDKTFSFLVIFHLAELYLDEYKLSEN